MSKYIRTYDGNVFEKHTFIINDVKYIGYSGGFKLYNESEIIKEADTIEELCDGIIVEKKDKPNHWFIMEINEFEEMDKEERLYQLKDYNFNAFIKTDKGLIYVAKMNDKGELELL